MTDVSRVLLADMETGEEIGILHADGTLETEDEYLRRTYEEIVESGDDYGAPMMDGYYDPDEDVHYDGFVHVEPGEKGFLLAVREAMPSPYDVAPEKAPELATTDKRLGRDRPDED